MIEITYEGALNALRTAVADRGGDFVYSYKGRPEFKGYCFYVHEDADGVTTPGCGVGYALNLLGVSLSALSEYENLKAGTALRYLEDDGLIAVEPRVKLLFDAFQTRQDIGATWGEALRVATWEI